VWQLILKGLAMTLYLDTVRHFREAETWHGKKLIRGPAAFFLQRLAIGVQLQDDGNASHATPSTGRRRSHFHVTVNFFSDYNNQ
jgi:hypothetical protein